MKIPMDQIMYDPEPHVWAVTDPAGRILTVHSSRFLADLACLDLRRLRVIREPVVVRLDLILPEERPAAVFIPQVVPPGRPRYRVVCQIPEPVQG